MKRETSRLSCALLVVGILTACGGSENVDGAAAGKRVNYSGRVIDENGTPLAAIDVTLENRQTDLSIKVVTEADGGFNANVDAGVYDILFDDPAAENYISLQKTAIDLQSDSNDKVPLAKNGVASKLLTGSVIGPMGAPAALQKLLLLPLVARYAFLAENTASSSLEPTFAMPDSRVVQADAQGKFSLLLETGWAQADIDFDLIALSPAANEFDFSKLQTGYIFSSSEAEEAYYAALRAYLRENTTEIVDIEKPKGPMHVNLRLGSGTQNLLNSIGQPSIAPDARKQQSEVDKRSGNMGNALQSAFLQIKNYAINGLSKLIPSAYAWYGNEEFRLVIESSTSRPGGVSVALVGTYNPPEKPKGVSFSYDQSGARRQPQIKLSEAEYTNHANEIDTLLRSSFWIEKIPEINYAYKADLYQVMPALCTFIIQSHYGNVAVISDSGYMHYDNDRIDGAKTYNIKMSMPIGSYLHKISCEDPSVFRR